MTPDRPMKTSLFWVSLGLSLASGLASQALLAFDPAAFMAHWFRNLVLLLALHLSTLGFVGLLVLGVLTQFLPMLLGRALSSMKAAALSLGLFFISAFALWCFFAGHRSAWLAAAAACGIILGVAAFISLAARALAGGSGHLLTRAMLASSLAYLLFTACLGALMAQGLAGPPMTAVEPQQLILLHMHLGLFGFAAFMIFGVSLELLPMFGLARNFSLLPGWIALGLGHLGMASLILSVFGMAGAWAASIWPWLLALSCLAYGVQVLLIAVKSLRKQLEPGPLHFRTSVALLLLAAAWGLGLRHNASPGAQAAYVYLILFGFVGGSILSQLQKILPLLSWVDRFSALAGRAKIPAAAELMPPGLPWMVPALHLAACALGFLGFSLASPALLQISGTLGCGCFAVMALIWAQCRRPGGVHFPTSTMGDHS